MSNAFSPSAFDQNAFSILAFAIDPQITDFVRPIIAKSAALNRVICRAGCLDDTSHIISRMSGIVGKAGSFTGDKSTSVGFIGDQGRFVCMGESLGYYVNISDIVIRSVIMND